MKLRIPLAWVLAGLLLLLAAVSRLLLLGVLPLQPHEASAAVSALQASPDASPFWPGQLQAAPAYTTLTLAILGAFGASEAAVRFVPAFAGGLLVLAPLLLRRKVGWTRALFVSFLLLVSSAVWSAARTAGPSSLAALGLVCPLVVLASWDRPPRLWNILAGASLGIGLAAGPGFWTGLLGWGLGAAVWMRWASGQRQRGLLGRVVDYARSMFWPALITFAMLSTRFGTDLSSAAAGLQGIGQWLAGWGAAGENALPLLVLLPIYEPLYLVGGLMALVSNWRVGERTDRLAALASLGALLLLVVYPGRQPEDLVWVVIPLAYLAAGWLERLIASVRNLPSPAAVFILGGVLLTLASFSYFQFQASMAGFGLASLDKVSQLYFAIASLAFGLALILLFGFGWSWRETYLAFQSALLLALVAVNVAAARSLSLPTASSGEVQLWHRAQTSRSSRFLEGTLAELSRLEVGREGGLEIELRGRPSPLLAWLLRNHDLAPFEPEAEPPPVIVAPEDMAEAPLRAEYLGQAFDLIDVAGWSGALPPEFFSWMLDRHAPTVPQRWIVFVRSDIVTFDQAGGHDEQ